VIVDPVGRNEHVRIAERSIRTLRNV